MSKELKTLGGIISMGMLLVAMNLGGVAGCGSSNNGNTVTGADDASVIASSQDADEASAAALNAASVALSAALSSSGSALKVPNAQSALAIKNAITVTTTGSCDQGNLPNPSGEVKKTVQGSVGGSCDVTADTNSSSSSTDVNAVVDCIDFNDGANAQNSVLDGSVGFSASVTSTSTDTTTDFDLSSKNLVVTLSDASNCSLVLNLTESVTTDNNSGSGSIEVNGCVSVCGESFTANGTETF